MLNFRPPDSALVGCGVGVAWRPGGMEKAPLSSLVSPQKPSSSRGEGGPYRGHDGPPGSQLLFINIVLNHSQMSVCLFCPLGCEHPEWMEGKDHTLGLRGKTNKPKLRKKWNWGEGECRSSPELGPVRFSQKKKKNREKGRNLDQNQGPERSEGGDELLGFSGCGICVNLKEKWGWSQGWRPRETEGGALIRAREHRRRGILEGEPWWFSSEQMEPKGPVGLDYRCKTRQVVLKSLWNPGALGLTVAWASASVAYYLALWWPWITWSTWPHNFSCSFLPSTWYSQWSSLRLHGSHSTALSEVT